MITVTVFSYCWWGGGLRYLWLLLVKTKVFKLNKKFLQSVTANVKRSNLTSRCASSCILHTLFLVLSLIQCFLWILLCSVDSGRDIEWNRSETAKNIKKRDLFWTDWSERLDKGVLVTLWRNKQSPQKASCGCVWVVIGLLMCPGTKVHSRPEGQENWVRLPKGRKRLPFWQTLHGLLVDNQSLLNCFWSEMLPSEMFPSGLLAFEVTTVLLLLLMLLLLLYTARTRKKQTCPPGNTTCRGRLAETVGTWHRSTSRTHITPIVRSLFIIQGFSKSSANNWLSF